MRIELGWMVVMSYGRRHWCQMEESMGWEITNTSAAGRLAWFGASIPSRAAQNQKNLAGGPEGKPPRARPKRKENCAAQEQKHSRASIDLRT